MSAPWMGASYLRLRDAMKTNTATNQFDLLAEMIIARMESGETLIQDVLEITPEFAKMFDKASRTDLPSGPWEPYVNNRPIDENHASGMDLSNRKTPTGIMFVVLKDGDRWSIIMIDGHHRMRNIRNGKRSIMATAVFVRVYSKMDVHAAYLEQDQGRKVRGLNEIIRSYNLAEVKNPAIDMPAPEYKVSASFARDACYAIRMMKRGFELGIEKKGFPDTAVEVMQGLSRFKRELEWFYSQVTDRTRSIPQAIKQTLLGPNTISLVLVTLRYDREAAERFWLDIIEGNGSLGTPTRTLLDEFNRPSLDARTNGRSYKAASGPIKCRMIAAVWNAHSDNLRMADLPLASSLAKDMRNIRINGCLPDYASTQPTYYNPVTDEFGPEPIRPVAK